MVDEKLIFATITMQHDVPKKDVQNLLVGLFENNYSPWLREIKSKNLAEGFTFTDFRQNGRMQDSKDYYHWSQIIPVTEGCSLTLSVDDPDSDSGGEKDFVLDIEAIRRGLQVMATKYRKHWNDFVDENDDANTADIFGQCCVYGEYIYS
jgi:hypothetical protein